MKRRTVLAAAVAGALALAGCTGKAAENTDPTTPGKTAVGTATLGMSYIPNIQFAPAYVAADKQLFGQRGAKVALRHHGANEGLFTALGAGQEDFLIAGADEMMQARAQGLDLVAIASYYRTYPVVIIVPADSGVRTLADLKGRVIGLPGKYGESWFGLQVALRTAGLTEADVTVQEIGYTQQAALTTKKVDAVVGFANNDAVQFTLAGVPTRSLPVADNVPLVSISLITTRKTAESNPALAKAVADGLVAGIGAVATDPEGAIDIATAQIPGLSDSKARQAARATLDATIKIMVGKDGKATGKLVPEQWTAMASFMRANGLLTKDVDPAAAMSNQYVSQ